MGFVDRLRMNNLYPNIGLQPPDFSGGLDINKLLRGLITQPTGQTVSPMNWQYTRNPPPQFIPSTTTPANDMLSRRLTGLDQDLYGQKDRLERDKLAQKNQIEQEKLNFNREKLAGTQDLGNRRADISQQRADIYKFKTENPDLQFKISQGGNFIAFNPVTGENFDTGVSSGTMSEEDKIKLLGTNQMNAITARNIGQEYLQRIRGNQRLEEIGANIAGRKEIAGMTPDRSELPTQTRVRQTNAARELFNTDPELAKFVDIKPDGSFEIIPPSTTFWGSAKGPSLDQFNRIKNAIYGTKPNPTTDTITNKLVQPSITSPTIPQVPAGRVAITKDGKTFSVPESQLQDALKQGYTKVSSPTQTKPQSKSEKK